jgi:hypothetical protein
LTIFAGILIFGYGAFWIAGEVLLMVRGIQPAWLRVLGMAVNLPWAVLGAVLIWVGFRRMCPTDAAGISRQ